MDSFSKCYSQSYPQVVPRRWPCFDQGRSPCPVTIRRSARLLNWRPDYACIACPRQDCDVFAPCWMRSAAPLVRLALPVRPGERWASPGYHRCPAQCRGTRGRARRNGLVRAPWPAFADVGRPRLPSLAGRNRRCPAATFVAGEPALLDRPQLAIVGSRRATPRRSTPPGHFPATSRRLVSPLPAGWR